MPDKNKQDKSPAPTKEMLEPKKEDKKPQPPRSGPGQKPVPTAPIRQR